MKKLETESVLNLLLSSKDYLVSTRKQLNAASEGDITPALRELGESIKHLRQAIRTAALALYEEYLIDSTALAAWIDQADA